MYQFFVSTLFICVSISFIHVVRSYIYELYRPSYRGTAVEVGTREFEESDGEARLIYQLSIYLVSYTIFPYIWSHTSCPYIWSHILAVYIFTSCPYICRGTAVEEGRRQDEEADSEARRNLKHIQVRPTLPYPTLPYPTLPYPTLPSPPLLYSTLTYPTLPYRTRASGLRAPGYV